MLYLIEDNGYAISVPVEVQTAGGSISKLVANYPGICTSRNATALIRSKVMPRCSRAVAHCRARKGPALVHAHVTRPYSHSLSDDEKLYKIARRTRRGGSPRSHPEIRAVSWCAKEFSTKRELEALEAEVESEVLEATDRALPAELPAKESIYDFVLFAGRGSRRQTIRIRDRNSQGEPKTMVEMVSGHTASTKWRATSASSCSAKTSPTAAAKRISKK